MELHVSIVIAILLLIIIWFIFTTAEHMTDKSMNPDKYGNAIAEVVKKQWHFDEFKQLIKNDTFDPTMFDTLFYYQRNNWLSKPNLVKILKKDYTNLNTMSTNTY